MAYGQILDDSLPPLTTPLRAVSLTRRLLAYGEQSTRHIAPLRSAPRFDKNLRFWPHPRDSLKSCKISDFALIESMKLGCFQGISGFAQKQS